MKLKRKVGERGQVVIPKDIREQEDIHPQNSVHFTVEDGKIVIEKGKKKLTEVFSRISRKSEGVGKTSDEYYREEIERRLKKADIK